MNEVLQNLRVVADNAAAEGVRVEAAVLRRWADEAQLLHDLLKAVQSDPGNWLHQDLDEKIEAAVGEAAPWRSIDDSGLAPAELKPPAD